MSLEIEKQLVSEFEAETESELAIEEGDRSMPYRDSEGILTIGMGHNLEASPLPLGWIAPLTFAQIVQLRRMDILKAESALAIKLPWTIGLPEGPRKGALIDLVFNMGIGRVLKFVNFLAAFKAGDWIAAAAELLDSDYGRKLPTRSARLAKQIRDNAWWLTLDVA